MELRGRFYLVAAEPSLYEPIFPCYVVGDDPAELAFFLLADARRDIVSAGNEDPPATMPLKAYATRLVKQRLHQERFRHPRVGGLSAAMRDVPAQTNTSAGGVAHPARPGLCGGTRRSRMGLALCRIHHGAYDVGILGIDPECRIHLRQDVLDERDGPMLLDGLQEMHGALNTVTSAGGAPPQPGLPGRAVRAVPCGVKP